MIDLEVSVTVSILLFNAETEKHELSGADPGFRKWVQTYTYMQISFQGYPKRTKGQDP